MIERVTIKVNKGLLDKIVNDYKKFEEPNSGEYIHFFAKSDDIVLTAYSSKKEDSYKVMFLGEHALKEARKYDKNAELSVPKENKVDKASWILLDDQIGSDEVGTGDFFGPICVCAAYVSKKNIARLKALGVDDSKRLSDDQIVQLGRILINEIPYSQVSLDNEKYNELVDKGMNMNEMKAKLHNQVLKNLHKKYPNIKNIVIDQFLIEKSYYKYLKDEKEIVEGITFKTKGESYYPSIAVGSIIARYSFLNKMKAMSDKYDMDIPFGASKKVTEFAKEFVKKYSKEELLKVVKKNFTNLSEVIK